MKEGIVVKTAVSLCVASVSMDAMNAEKNYVGTVQEVSLMFFALSAN